MGKSLNLDQMIVDGQITESGSKDLNSAIH